MNRSSSAKGVAKPAKTPAPLAAKLDVYRSNPTGITVNSAAKPAATPRRLGREFALMLLLLLAVLAVLLHGVFVPHQTLFSNDGPLGRLVSKCRHLPERFMGCWGDLNAFGFSGGSATPGITMGLQFLLKPFLFSKVYALATLMILGLGAWCFFSQLRLAPLACVLGGLAAALNSCFFSVACWGVAAQAATMGMLFFALAALTDTTSPQRWWRVILAGFAVGMAVIEGADVGAIYSLFVVIFILYQAWLGDGLKPWRRANAPGLPEENRSGNSSNQGTAPSRSTVGAPKNSPENAVPLAQRTLFGFSRVALVAVCAAFFACQAVVSLVDTSIVGVAGAQQDEETKDSRWGWATQWSLPPEELTAMVVPGLFGYRTDTPQGGSYWGATGRAAAVDAFLMNGRQGKPPQGLLRQTGGGNYAGVLVVMLAFWVIGQSLRRRDRLYQPIQCRWIWFWLVLAVISTLLCFGKYAPFYRWLYALPYFSTIRNPTKFINLLSLSLVVMFAYAVDGLWRRHMQSPGLVMPSPVTPKAGRTKAVQPGRAWKTGCLVILGISLLAWLDYYSSHQALVNYLRTVGFKDTTAEATASFSIRQVGWFVLFFTLAAGLVGAIFSGAFTGARARWGGILLGLLLCVDLGRANLPWVIYWNYPEKYASNPIIDRLRDKPYEHRVTIQPGTMPPNIPSLTRMYRLEWLQQQFPYYNVQTIDIVDMPRKPVDYKAYMENLVSFQETSGLQAYVRYWELTSTDYVLGRADSVDSLNGLVRQTGKPFQIVQRFDIVPKPGVTDADTNLWQNMTAAPNDNGTYALYNFTGALPRAKLFTNWEDNTNDPAVLRELISPDFDPWQSVLVSGGLPPGSTRSTGQPQAGTVDYQSYAPKDIVLKCNATASSILLLNDRIDPDWHVRVDGRPETLLRCNYLMRGVWVPPGTHTVEFQYRPNFRLLYVSLSAMGAAVLVLMGVLFTSRRPVNRISPPAPETTPA